MAARPNEDSGTDRRLGSASDFFRNRDRARTAHFGRREAEIVVLETGMGGRLDATNATAASRLGHHADRSRSSRMARRHSDKNRRRKSGHHQARIRSFVPPRAGSRKSDSRAIRGMRRADSIRHRRRAKTTSAWSEHINRKTLRSQIEALRAAKIDVTAEAITRGLAKVEWPARFRSSTIKS